MALSQTEIDTLTRKPATVAGEAGSATQRPAADLIQLDQYAAAAAALAGTNPCGGPKSAFRLLRPARANMPGAK